MGFGASTTVGNVAVDLVQADVDSLITGIANGKTLADLDDVLDSIYGINSQISTDTGYLGYLYSTSAGWPDGQGHHVYRRRTDGYGQQFRPGP
jgi:hypothetical protein